MVFMKTNSQPLLGTTRGRRPTETRGARNLLKRQGGHVEGVRGVHFFNFWSRIRQLVVWNPSSFDLESANFRQHQRVRTCWSERGVMLKGSEGCMMRWRTSVDRSTTCFVRQCVYLVPSPDRSYNLYLAWHSNHLGLLSYLRFGQVLLPFSNIFVY